MMSCPCNFCKFQPESNQVLYAIEAVTDIKIYFVTDKSNLLDFALNTSELKQLEASLGVPVSNKDHVWEIAQRLRSK